jgi:predicted amidohydrolase
MRAAIYQASTGVDPAASAATLAEVIARAGAGGADMLFTPEMSNVLDRDRARAAASIVTEGEDRTLAAAREGAAKHGLWIHVGSLALKGGSDGRNLNRGFVIDDKGEIRARYDKLHLFDVDLPNGNRWRESDAYQPGEQAIVVGTPWGKLGLAICYDIRFPDLFRSLSNAGATILSLPAAFTVPSGQAHWHVLLRARAIEAGAFMIAAAQSGGHADGRDTYGHSLAIDPWGEVLLDLGEGERLDFADLDLDRIAEVQGKIPVLKHRRAIPAVETR